MKEKLLINHNAIGKVWYSDSPNLDYFHRHDELECNLVCRGRGSYIVGNQRIDLEPTTIVWLFPEQEHLMLNTSDDFALWILVIRPKYLQQTCTDNQSQPLLESNPAGQHVRHISPAAFQQLEAICQQAATTSAKPDLHNATLGYLLHRCWDSYQQGSVAPLGQHIHPAIQTIAKQLLGGFEPTDLQQLSQQVGLAPETISRLFKQQTGVTLTAYRNRCRLERFLLRYGNGHTHTMLDAALAAGFGSYAQFYRVFCNLMGHSPADYRRGRDRP